MRVSAIISNFNGARFIPRLLESLRAQQGVETEILVVDRFSTDGSPEILARHPEVRVLREPAETGLVAGYHAGSLHASSDLLFFCNEDMWFEPDCLRLLAERIDLPARIAAADGWHFGYDRDEFLHGATRFVRSRWAINSPHPLRSADFEDRLPAGSRTPFACAGAFLIHRDVYRELGGWDVGFFLDHEDIDLFLRAWQRGWGTVSVPEALIHHAVNASNNQTLSSLNLSVGERRYLSQRASLAIIALKYFSVRMLPLAALVWPAVFLNNIGSRRWGFARRDFRVLAEIVRRAPGALAYRRTNARHNREMPGERFFTSPEFSDG
jgi:GT2 family glycosyltransferase